MDRKISEGKFGLGGLKRIAIVLAACLAAAPTAASALEAGAYCCRIAEAVLTTKAGEKVELKSAPKEFVVHALVAREDSNSLQREGPLRRLDYHDEDASFAPRARVEPWLFSGAAAEIESEDGVLYAQERSAFRFQGEGRFNAEGEAAFSEGEGLSVYLGDCEKL